MTSRETFDALTAAVANFLAGLNAAEGRITVVANYFTNGTVRIGRDIAKNAATSETTSASATSPVGNVVSRLLPR